MRQFLALVLLVAAVPAAAQPCSEAERTKLQALDRTWGDATTRGDRAHLQSLYADDFMGASFTGTQGKAAAIDNAVLQAERQRASPQGAPALAFDNYVVTCTPRTATITHRNVVTTSAGGTERTTYSRSVHFLEKRGDRWQVVGNAGHGLDDAALLQYMESDWNEAIRKGDVAWVERNYASDATDIGSRTGALEGKAEAIASMRSDKFAYESLELSELSARVEGNTAIVTGVNHARGRDAQGKPTDRRIRFTDTFVRRDGRWQVWATQGTLIQ